MTKKETKGTCSKEGAVTLREELGPSQGTHWGDSPTPFLISRPGWPRHLHSAVSQSGSQMHLHRKAGPARSRRPRLCTEAEDKFFRIVFLFYDYKIPCALLGQCAKDIKKNTRGTPLTACNPHSSNTIVNIWTPSLCTHFNPVCV